MNVFGVDVSELDRADFYALGRIASLVLVLISATVYFKTRRVVVLGAAVLLLVTMEWIMVVYPLERVYGLEFPGDRLRNMTWVTSVAAGNSPLSTGRIGEISLEPFWALFAGSLIFGHPERIDILYAVLSLVVKIGLGASLFLHFRREGKEIRDGLGLAVAASVLLLATGPLDYMQPFRAFDARVFLLKPNHALGLVLIPLLVGLVARRPKPWQLATTVLVLALLGWVFVIHWAFFCFSLAIYLALTWLLARADFRERLSKTVLLVGASALLVAPYVWLIYQQHPYALSLATVDYPDAPTRSIWGDMLPVGTSLLLLVTLDRGILFVLAVVGVWDWLKRSTPKNLLWSSLLIASYLLWAVNYLGYLTARAREADEFYYFLTFNLAVAAGNGIYQIGRHVVLRLREERDDVVATGGILAALLAASVVQPYWWHPELMDAHFRRALEPIPEEIVEVRDWVLSETRGDDVFLGDGELSFWVPALTGRQILSPQVAGPEALERILAGEPARELRVTYVLFTSEMIGALEMHPEQLGERRGFRRVFRRPHVTIFRIES